MRFKLFEKTDSRITGSSLIVTPADLVFKFNAEDPVKRWASVLSYISNNLEEATDIWFHRKVIGSEDLSIAISGKNAYYMAGINNEILDYVLINPPIGLYRELWIFSATNKYNLRANIEESLKTRARKLNKDMAINDLHRHWFIEIVMKQI